jgi:uncharacterized protein (TIRG00374 family)
LAQPFSTSANPKGCLLNPEGALPDALVSSLFQPSRKRWFQSGYFWLGTVISLGCLVLALWGLRLIPFLQALQAVRWGWALLALVVSLLTLLAKAARWKTLFQPGYQFPFNQSFSRLMTGIFLNMVLPARLGDLVRALPSNSSSEIPTAYSLGTIVLEKALDAALLLVTLLFVLTRLVLPGWLTGPSRDLALIFCIFLIAISLLTWQRGRLIQLISRITSHLPSKWQHWADRQSISALASLEILRSPRYLVPALAWSLGILGLGVLTNLLVFWALGIRVGLWPAIVLFLVLQVGVAVPSSPGRVGVFQYLTILALGLFGLSKEIGLLAGVLLHLVVFLPILLLGSWFLWRSWSHWQTLLNRTWQALSGKGYPNPSP